MTIPADLDRFCHDAWFRRESVPDGDARVWWYDPVDSALRANPVYGVERDRGGSLAVATRILAYSVLAAVYFVLAWLSMDAFAHRTTVPSLAIGLPATSVILVSALWSSTQTATWLATERARNTLSQILVAPFPRRAMLWGVTAARLRPVLHLLAFSLPAFLAAGPLICWADARWLRPSGDLLCMLWGSSLGLFLWTLCLLAFSCGTTAGWWASLQARSVGGALAVAYSLLLGLGLVAATVCPGVLIVLWVVRTLAGDVEKCLDREGADG